MSPIKPFSALIIIVLRTPYAILISPIRAADSGGLSWKNPPFRLLIGLFQAWHSASGIFSGRQRAVALLDNVCYLMLGCPFSCLGSLVHHGDLMPQATNGDTYIGKIMRPQGITLSSVFHSEL